MRPGSTWAFACQAPAAVTRYAPSAPTLTEDVLGPPEERPCGGEEIAFPLDRATGQFREFQAVGLEEPEALGLADGHEALAARVDRDPRAAPAADGQELSERRRLHAGRQASAEMDAGRGTASPGVSRAARGPRPPRGTPPRGRASRRRPRIDHRHVLARRRGGLDEVDADRPAREASLETRAVAPADKPRQDRGRPEKAEDAGDVDGLARGLDRQEPRAHVAADGEAGTSRIRSKDVFSEIEMMGGGMATGFRIGDFGFRIERRNGRSHGIGALASQSDIPNPRSEMPYWSNSSPRKVEPR